MTTIAYREGILAGDRQISRGGPGGCFGGTMLKVIYGRHGDIAGACGKAGYISAFLSWVAEGRKGSAPYAGAGDEGILVLPSGSVFYFDASPKAYRLDATYHAIGSGSDFAHGAMGAGCGAERAVEIAAEHDGMTSGPVDVVMLKPPGRK